MSEIPEVKNIGVYLAKKTSSRELFRGATERNVGIPADIIKAAEDALKRVRWSREEVSYISTRDSVAAAILAERERCAMIFDVMAQTTAAASSARFATYAARIRGED